MKSLKTVSQLCGLVTIGAGSILFVKGVLGTGIWWATISGAVLICSGIINIFAVRLGIFETLRILLLKLLELPEKLRNEKIQ